ncbi:beta-defensin 108B-like [Sus scrofa]|uniref:beta-defensin 108B-like n=1 Tax=Sus scrofa TaxID=9823 RepID=UPI000A2B876E|nr:beta-defensin 108B-like [Sus scrofa]
MGNILLLLGLERHYVCASQGKYLHFQGTWQSLGHSQRCRGHFKVVCECPNGSCQEFCLDSEIQVGKCLDGCVCCLPLGNVPQVDPTTPSGG